MEINNRIVAILKDNYGIKVTLIEQKPGGWSALAFLIEDESKKYFLKVYNKKSLLLNRGLKQLTGILLSKVVE
ncbi:hypothetical protein MGI18_13240 [Bacillus sp. OVS6]|nr:hypothetical protein MGI18_13240 [Bacillus sp. OVS6]